MTLRLYKKGRKRETSRQNLKRPFLSYGIVYITVLLHQDFELLIQ